MFGPIAPFLTAELGYHHHEPFRRAESSRSGSRPRPTAFRYSRTVVTSACPPPAPDDANHVR
jgi:hypothetical protein